jgi:succinyl-diaminopimelate desuccinylase
MPYKGVNAFERMIILAAELEKLKKHIRRRKTKFRMKDKISRGPSFVMGGLLEGGIKVNVVPGIARFSIDRRLIPEEDISTAQKEIESVIKRFNAVYRDCAACVNFSSKEAPCISPYDKEFFDAVSGAIKDVTGSDAEFCIMTGATDLRYFMRKGIPALGYSSSGGEKWHGDNEYVSIKSLVNTARVYAKVIASLNK